MRYKGIFIDADDTLFDFQTGEHVAAGRMLEFLRYSDPGALTAYQEINAALWRDLEKGLTTQAKLKVRRFELLMARYGVEGSPGRRGGVLRGGAVGAVHAAARSA